MSNNTIKEHSQKTDDDPLRGTGRTTALMLHAIANALEHPDTYVEFRDHYPMTKDRQRLLLAAMRGLYQRVGLTLDTAIVGDAITVRSPISRMRVQQ